MKFKIMKSFAACRFVHVSLMGLSCGLLLLMGCSSVGVTDHRKFTPELVPEKFFNGELTAHGVVKNRSGKIIRTFNATIKASWDKGVGTLDEDFIFDDGEKQKRVWTLVPEADSTYRATASDVVGAGQAKTAGNSLFLKYVLRVPYNDDTIDLTIDDRMYLVDEDTLLNESGMYKFGFRVGSILLVIKK